MLTGARNLVSPSRFPFRWSKNPEALVNQKVTCKLQSQGVSSTDWPPCFHPLIPKAATRCRCRWPVQYRQAGLSTYVSADAYTVQSLQRTQWSPSTLELPEATSLNLDANTQALQHMLPGPSGSCLTDLTWGHLSLFLV